MNKITNTGVLFFILCFSVFAGEKISVVSLSPSLTELVFQLGRGGRLVGRSAVCNYPEDAKKVPVVGNFGAPSMEKLITVKADVVLSSALKDRSFEKTIEGMGIKFILLPTDSIEDYYIAVEKLGNLLDCKEEAVNEITRIRNGLKCYREKTEIIPFNKRPLVYLEIWDRPLMTVGNRSFINDFIDYAGGRNIANNEEKDYFSCSAEWVIISNPDVIICPAMEKGRIADVLKRAGWSCISAVKNHRIYTDLDDDLIYRLGPRMLEGIELIYKCVFPEQGDSCLRP